MRRSKSAPRQRRRWAPSSGVDEDAQNEDCSARTRSKPQRGRPQLHFVQFAAPGAVNWTKTAPPDARLCSLPVLASSIAQSPYRGLLIGAFAARGRRTLRASRSARQPEARPRRSSRQPPRAPAASARDQPLRRAASRCARQPLRRATSRSSRPAAPRASRREINEVRCLNNLNRSSSRSPAMR
jgi:hypothetical protein